MNVKLLFFSWLVGLSSVSSYAGMAWAEETTREMHLLHVASSQHDAPKALRLTKALEHRLLRSRDVRFVNSGHSLLETLEAAKCGKVFADRAFGIGPKLDASADREIDAGCEGKLATLVGAPFGPVDRYLWGWIYQDASGHDIVTVHFWQRGQLDRIVTLPLAELLVEGAPSADPVADRLYMRLLETKAVGDVRLIVPEVVQGEVVVDGVTRGPWSDVTAEMTVPAGTHTFEVRTSRGSWQARADVTVSLAGQVQAITLVRTEQSSVPVGANRSRSLAPLIIGGSVGVLGVAGAFYFHTRQQSVQDDIDSVCTNTVCPPRARDRYDERDRFRTISAVFLGVGLVGVSAGIVTYLLNPPGASPKAKSASALRWSMHPIVGGAATSLSGKF